jgi:hypothetical protein
MNVDPETGGHCAALKTSAGAYKLLPWVRIPHPPPLNQYDHMMPKRHMDW